MPSHRLPIHPAIIFDLDGTLVDSLEDIATCVNLALAELSKDPITLERLRPLVGDGVRSMLQHAQTDRPDQVVKLYNTYCEAYGTNMLVHTHLYEGIERALTELSSAAIPMCVLSNKLHDQTKAICQNLLSAWPFVRFQGTTDESLRKPNPAHALALARAMHREPKDVFFVGDSAIDIATARNADMLSVAVTWGYRDTPELIRAAPDYLIDAPPELLAVIRQSPSITPAQ